MSKKSRNLKKIINKRSLPIALALVAIVVIAYIILASKTKPGAEISPTVTSTPTPTSVPTGNITDAKPDQAASTTHPSSGSINIVVSVLGQDVAGGPLLVRTILEGATGTGTCTIKATSGSTTKSYSTDIVFAGTYYSCNYSIPFTDLSSGQWSVSVSAMQNDRTGEIANTVNLKN